ncbi:M56 family metallopeptidase [Georgenia deserti]|uniref:M56 family metallopeptidase n=1 Tax=Georgenia deserti TaxID=2093781 RepID=A0ABW4L666_9MICO
MTALALTALAVVLSMLAPVPLSRFRPLEEVPGAAVALWQCVALAAALAAVGAALAAPEEILRGLHGGRVPLGPALFVGAGLALVLAGVIVVRLAVVTARLAWNTRRRRRRQLEMLDLLEGAARERSRLHVLAARLPLAYCIPGRPGRVVLTEATLDLLTPAETDAVVAHELAHLRARHDLVVEAFTALHIAFPQFVRSRLALESVNRLLEMLADDAATRHRDPAPLYSALTKLAATAEAGEEVGARLGRLRRRLSGRTPRRTRLRLLTVGTYTLGIAVLAVPTVAIVTPWLQAALGALPW